MKFFMTETYSYNMHLVTSVCHNPFILRCMTFHLLNTYESAKNANRMNPGSLERYEVFPAP